jgi:hypothetical protein
MLGLEFVKPLEQIRRRLKSVNVLGLGAKTSLATKKDSDLKSLAKGPRFVAILADARRRAAAGQKTN